MLHLWSIPAHKRTVSSVLLSRSRKEDAFAIGRTVSRQVGKYESEGNTLIKYKSQAYLYFAGFQPFTCKTEVVETSLRPKHQVRTSHCLPLASDGNDMYLHVSSRQYTFKVWHRAQTSGKVTEITYSHLVVKELSLDKPKDQRRLSSAHVPQQDKLGLLDCAHVGHHDLSQLSTPWSGSALLAAKHYVGHPEQTSRSRTEERAAGQLQNRVHMEQLCEIFTATRETYVGYAQEIFEAGPRLRQSSLRTALSKHPANQHQRIIAHDHHSMIL
jgi:hypothetical protein